MGYYWPKPSIWDIIDQSQVYGILLTKAKYMGYYWPKPSIWDIIGQSQVYGILLAKAKPDSLGKGLFLLFTNLFLIFFN